MAVAVNVAMIWREKCVRVQTEMYGYRNCGCGHCVCMCVCEREIERERGEGEVAAQTEVA